MSFLVTATIQHFPLLALFRIARGAKTEAVVVSVEVAKDGFIGRGECVPYPRYGETPESVITQIQSIIVSDRMALQSQLPPGAARNAVDCALWDHEAKAHQKPVWQLADLALPQPCITAYTISLDTPAAMYAAAQAAANRPLLKIKLGTRDDLDRLKAVRDAAPEAHIIIDANEGWQPRDLEVLLPQLQAENVSLIEQPLPVGKDDSLRGLRAPIPICADESVHTSADISALADRYQAVNIKLDKTGGLTEALQAVRNAKAADLKIMIGCMVGSSLAMAPAAMLANHADFVDLDGPLLLAKDRMPGLQYDTSLLHPYNPALWG